MTDLDQAVLLRDFKGGEEAAFERVFKLYYKALRLQALLMLKDEEEAEDQVQQLFIDMWNKKLYRKVERSIKPYLHAALRHRCLNHLAKTGIQMRLQNEYAGYKIQGQMAEKGFEPELEPSPESCLLSVLDELPAQRFTAFDLVHLKDKKYQEAAREMGISVNSLKTHLKLAVRFLRMRLS